MKTKHILTALALPAMFAACTADDIEGLNNGMQQQAERAKLSKDFVLNTSNEVDSRYVVEGTTGLKFTFEEGDLIGANLVDAFEPNTEKGYDYDTWDKEDPATWKIVNTIAPALPFENIGGESWKSAGDLGIGNYIFTNPYNPADKNRAATKFELPIVIHYDVENPNAHIEDYNKAVSAVVLREGETQANISLKNLYTYPKFRINFDKDDDVTKVTKIILKKESGFIYKGAFNHQDVVDLFDQELIDEWLEDPKNEGLTVTDYWAQVQTSDFIIDGNEITDDVKNYADIDTTPYFVYEMDAKVVSDKIEVRFMLPSVADFSDVDADDAITMYICTDKGNYKVDVTDLDSYTFGGTTLLDKKIKALWRSTSNTLTVRSEAVLDAEDDEVDELLLDNIVSTANDWNKLVAKYGDLKKYSAAYKALEEAGKVDDAEEIVVKIYGDKFTLNSDLKMPAVAEFVIESDVEVEGELTLKNVLVRKAATAETDPVVVVKKDAVLTTSQSFFAPEVKVEKGASLKFDAAYNEDKELIAYTGVQRVKNFGEVTVLPGAEATFYIVNEKADSKLYVGAPAARAEVAEAVANIINYTVSKTDIKPSLNYGEIYNYGEINVDGTLNNEGPSTEVGYKKDSETNEYTDRPAIVNEGTFNVKGAVNNRSDFANNKTLSSNFSGGNFTNYAEMTVKAGASTYIDSNSGATIVLAEMNPADFTIHKAKGKGVYATTDAGTIKYTLGANEHADVKMGTSPVTYLIANGDVTINETYNYTDAQSNPHVKALPTLEVNGGEITISNTKNSATTPAYKAQVTNLVVMSGKATISGKIESLDNIKVMKNASLTVIETADVTIKNAPAKDTSVLKEGDKAPILYMNGLMHLSGVIKTGDYLTTSNDFIKLGKDKKITCGDPTDTSVQDAYNAAVNVAWLNKYEYNNFLKPDMDWFAAAVVKNNVITPMQNLLKKLYGDNLATDFTNLATEEKKIASLKNKLTATNFETARAKHIYFGTNGVRPWATGEEAAFKASFIEDGLFSANVKASIQQSADVHETETEAYESIIKAFNSNNTDLNVNVWQYFTTDNVKAALNAKNQEFGGVSGKYVFVWEGCDLDLVVSVMTKLPAADWADLFDLTASFDSEIELYTIEGVKKFLYEAYKAKEATAAAAEDAVEIAKTYYEASKTWGYSTEQVIKVAGASNASLEVELPTIE